MEAEHSMKYSVAIDLGGTNIASGIVSEEGELVYKASVPVENSSDINSLLCQVSEAVKQTAKDSEIPKEDIVFVGIGIPGICKSEKGPVIFAPNIFWKDVDVVSVIENSVGLPVILGNDADCAAIGEYRLGMGKGFRSMLMLTLGTGVGGSIIYDGKIGTGFGSFGGEFGHIPLVSGGVQCNCGKRGCFEVYCSAVALKRQTREAAMLNKDSVIWDMCEGDLDNIGGRTPFDAAEKGDSTGIQIVDQYITYLADGISGLINVFRPEIVVLGGGVSNQGDSLIDPLNEKVSKMCYSSPDIEPPKVYKATLGNKAGIIGAGLLGF